MIREGTSKRLLQIRLRAGYEELEKYFFPLLIRIIAVKPNSMSAFIVISISAIFLLLTKIIMQYTIHQMMASDDSIKIFRL